MLVLASNSPRRKQLLALGGWAFEVLPAVVDESPFLGETPHAYVLRLARLKAQAVASEERVEAVVIGADTIVADGSDLLGKPQDKGEAETMLRRLRGRVHQVHTALAVLRVTDGTLLTDWCITDVPMRDFTDMEMQTYIASGDPLDKAGSYAIQHPGFKPVENLQGCYANVVGMPLCHLTRTLRKLDIAPETDIPRVCQDELRYQCPVYDQVLSTVTE